MNNFAGAFSFSPELLHGDWRIVFPSQHGEKDGEKDGEKGVKKHELTFEYFNLKKPKNQKTKAFSGFGFWFSIFCLNFYFFNL